MYQMKEVVMGRALTVSGELRKLVVDPLEGLQENLPPCGITRELVKTAKDMNLLGVLFFLLFLIVTLLIDLIVMLLAIICLLVFWILSLPYALLVIMAGLFWRVVFSGGQRKTRSSTCSTT